MKQRALKDRLLSRVFPGPRSEEMLGDLSEESALRFRMGTSVRGWYWSQVFRSILTAAAMSARHGRWLSTAGIATAAYVTAGVVEYLAQMALKNYVDVRPGTVAGALIGLAALAAAGFAAARWQRTASFVMAGIAALGMVALISIDAGSVPRWYQLTFLFAGPLSSCAGGMLKTRRRSAVRARRWKFPAPRPEMPHKRR